MSDHDIGIVTGLNVQRGNRLTVTRRDLGGFWTITLHIEGANESQTTINVFSDRDPGDLNLDFDLTKPVAAEVSP